MPINPRKTPRQARSAAMVEAVLEAAARILEAEGLAGFNTNAVAEKAGVSIGSLYQYFPAKEALLAALIRRKRESLLAMIMKAKAKANTVDMHTVLDAFIRAALHHYMERPRLVSSLEYAEASLPLDEETVALKRSIVAAVADVLRLHHVPEPLVAARDLAALVRGMVDATGMFGEPRKSTLESRIRRAVHGYLGMSAVAAPQAFARA